MRERIKSRAGGDGGGQIVSQLRVNDRDLRLAKELGCRIVINSDSHDARNLGRMDYGLRQLRRAWLSPADVLNTLGPEEFLAALRPRA